MKILHIIGFFDENAWFRENYYTQYLAKNNEVSIITSNVSFPYKELKKIKYRSGTYTYENVKVYRKKCIHFKDLVFFRFKKEIDLIKPDVVHLYEFRQFISYILARYCIRNKIPFVYEHEQRGTGLTRLGKIKSYFFIEPFIKEIIPYASAVRTVTNGAAEYLKKISNYKSIYITTLGYDSDRSYFDQNNSSKFINTNKEIVFGVTGKITRRKKIEVIINAFKDSRVEQNKLIVVGSFDKEYYKKIKSMESNSVSIYNYFMNKNELNTFFSRCDYLIYTSPTISFFEALGTGATIIIPRGSATNHLVSNNIIFYGNDETISYMDNLIVDDNSIQKELSSILKALKKRKRFIDRKFDIKNIVKELEDQYLSIVERRNIMSPEFKSNRQNDSTLQEKQKKG